MAGYLIKIGASAATIASDALRLTLDLLFPGTSLMMPAALMDLRRRRIPDWLEGADPTYETAS